MTKHADVQVHENIKYSSFLAIPLFAQNQAKWYLKSNINATSQHSLHCFEQPVSSMNIVRNWCKKWLFLLF